MAGTSKQTAGAITINPQKTRAKTSLLLASIAIRLLLESSDERGERKPLRRYRLIRNPLLTNLFEDLTPGQFFMSAVATSPAGWQLQARHRR